jgi:hypothetical protein
MRPKDTGHRCPGSAYRHGENVRFGCARSLQSASYEFALESDGLGRGIPDQFIESKREFVKKEQFACDLHALF